MAVDRFGTSWFNFRYVPNERDQVAFFGRTGGKLGEQCGAVGRRPAVVALVFVAIVHTCGIDVALQSGQFFDRDHTGGTVNTEIIFQAVLGLVAVRSCVASDGAGVVDCVRDRGVTEGIA